MTKEWYDTSDPDNRHPRALILQALLVLVQIGLAGLLFWLVMT